MGSYNSPCFIIIHVPLFKSYIVLEYELVGQITATLSVISLSTTSNIAILIPPGKILVSAEHNKSHK